MPGKTRMTEKDVLLDLLQDLAAESHATLDGTSIEALRWRPDAEANNIAVTVWHLSRAFDILKVRILANQPVEAEMWHTRGWAAKTGYDPRGKGRGGLGNLAGYNREQVEEVPTLTAPEIVSYFSQVFEALYSYLEDMPSEWLYEPPAWFPQGSPPESTYVYIRNFMMDAREHLGEIKAIKAMWERRQK